MRARTAFAAAILAFCSAFTTTFDGCGGGGRPSTPLPPSPEPTCISDSDCPATGCEDRRCIGGTCTIIASFRDGDGDGDGPPPCGGDCNDADGTIAPGRTEICDGLDQDCDGTLDEGAPPTVRRRVLGVADDRVRAAPFDTGLILLETALTDGLSAIAADFTGRVGTSRIIESGEDPDLYDVARADDGAVVVVFHGSTGLIEGIPITVGAGGEPTPGTRFTIADLSLSPALDDVAAYGLPFGDTLVLAVSWIGPAGAFVWIDGFAVPVSVEPSSAGGPPDLATDGTSLVVAVASNRALFLDPATGVETASQTITGSWARNPIDSDDGRVIAVVRDAFDAAVVAFTPTTATTARPAPSASPLRLPGRIDTGPEFHVVTRFDDGFTSPTSSISGVWAGAVEAASLDALGDPFPREAVSGSSPDGSPVVDFDVVVSEHGAAVLSSFGRSGTTIATFACGEEG